MDFVLHLLWIWLVADVAVVAYLTYAHSAKADPAQIHAVASRGVMGNRCGKAAAILTIDKRQTRKLTHSGF